MVKEFKNKNQKSYYAQWNRFNIIGNTIFRSWCDKNQTILQYVLPKNRIQEVLKESHDPPHSGHLGKNKTGDRIKERFYWPHWEKDVEEYIQSCQVCQQTKAHHLNHPELNPISSSRPFQIITADIMGPLPKSSKQNTHALVIIDHFTKWSEIFPLRSTTTEKIAEKILKYIYQHGIKSSPTKEQIYKPSF